MTANEFREILTNMVKACGKELIERAEDLVGDSDRICSFDISIHFPIDGYRFDGVPTIEVHREHPAEKAIDVLVKSL